jgi:hypothetical protein
MEEFQVSGFGFRVVFLASILYILKLDLANKKQETRNLKPSSLLCEIQAAYFLHDA